MKQVYAIILNSKNTTFTYCLGIYDNQELAQMVAINQSIIKNMNYKIIRVDIKKNYRYLFAFFIRKDNKYVIEFSSERKENVDKTYHFLIENDKNYMNKLKLDILHQTLDHYDAESKKKLQELVFSFYQKHKN